MADSLEYRTIFECFGSLVTAFKSDPVAIADELAAVSLIPPPQDVADQKKSDLARRLAEDIRDRVKLSPSRYEDVVRVLSKHKWLEDIVRILQNTNEQLKVKDRQAVSTCVTAECDQSDGGKELLSYRFGYDLGEIPHCKSTLKVSDPVVSFASLDEDDLEDLQAQMSELTKEIRLEFNIFFSAIFKSFRDSTQIDRDKLVITLMDKEAVFEKDEVDKTKTVYDVFRMIRSHCSYFNYDVLKTMIQVDGSDRDKTYLEEYNKAFTEYCKAMPCAEGVYGNESSKSKRTKLKFKLDYELEQLKPNDVLSIKNNIARCLGIRPSSLYLCRVKESCVLFEFLVPDFIVEKLLPLSDSQILDLYSEVKVLSMEQHLDIKHAASQLTYVTDGEGTNIGKGGKNRRRGRYEPRRELIFKEDLQEYAQVTKVPGNGWVEANCFDGKQRRCRIRGSIKKRVWIRSGDIVLVSLREYEEDKGDIFHKYDTGEAANLVRYGEIPDTVDLSYTGSGVNEFEEDDGFEVDFDRFGYRRDQESTEGSGLRECSTMERKIESTMKAFKQKVFPVDPLTK